MTQKDIKKYRNKSVPQLIKLAERYFNEFIRLRDKGQKCISCDNSINQAGHYYSGGHYPALKFNEDNVNGQCLSCNYHKHGNLIEYRKKLKNKIGEERLNKLDELAGIYKRSSFKWLKIDLINIIVTYRDKVKTLKRL